MNISAHLSITADGDSVRLRVYENELRTYEVEGSSIDGSDALVDAEVRNLRAQGVHVSECVR